MEDLVKRSGKEKREAMNKIHREIKLSGKHNKEKKRNLVTLTDGLPRNRM